MECGMRYFFSGENYWYDFWFFNLGLVIVNGGSGSCVGVICFWFVNGYSICKYGECFCFCYEGFGDCNGKYYDGCEIDLEIVENCGKCGVECKLKYYEIVLCEYGKCVYLDKCVVIRCGKYLNFSFKCYKGKCEIMCNFGYVDCNKDIEDGCEVCLYLDVKNCGECDNECKVYKKYGGKFVCRYFMLIIVIFCVEILFMFYVFRLFFCFLISCYMYDFVLLVCL